MEAYGSIEHGPYLSPLAKLAERQISKWTTGLQHDTQALLMHTNGTWSL